MLRWFKVSKDGTAFWGKYESRFTGRDWVVGGFKDQNGGWDSHLIIDQPLPPRPGMRCASVMIDFNAQRIDGQPYETARKAAMGAEEWAAEIDDNLEAMYKANHGA